ncbi:MAG: replicative DNA helicase [Alcaligenaceae bacterium]|nr:replicative DNA helicase [Alcaligenaceae bacterium]
MSNNQYELDDDTEMLGHPFLEVDTDEAFVSATDLSDETKSLPVENFSISASMPEDGVSPKLPPQSIEIEQFLLGAILLDSSCIDKLDVNLQSSDFYKKEHQEIWTHIWDLFQKDRPIDALTVYDAILSKEPNTSVTRAYLSDLVSNSVSSANIRHHVSLIKDKSTLRKVIQTSNSIIDMCYNPNGRESKEILDYADKELYQISESGRSRDDRTFLLSKVVVQVLEQIEQKEREAAQTGKSNMLGISTGFVDLDSHLSGLQKGQLIIVAGRPAMGKTSFAMNMVEHIGVHLQKPVMVFSMEMGADQLATRMLASLARVDQQKIRYTNLEAKDWGSLTESMDKMLAGDVEIDESSALTPMDIRAKTRRWARKHQGNVSLIVVDYLQLMSAPSKHSDNRATEVSDITRSLKNLARELNCPVIALSQLNRGVENRTNKRPMMSDLRESGAIEQDADVILFIYRDEVYNPETTTEKGVAEIIIGKQRNGPIGTVKLAFNGACTRFENLAFN